MSALQYLTALLQPGTEIGSAEHSDHSNIDSLLKEMLAASNGRKAAPIPESQQLEAVKRFWPSQEASSFKDVYLLSWALCIPHSDDGACMFESTPHLKNILAHIDQYDDRPVAFRRCYQGLVKGYFQYNGSRRSENLRVIASANKPQLREYLRERSHLIHSERSNPVWVQLTHENLNLFGKEPCTPYIEPLLNGDSSKVEEICRELQIGQESWFQEELVLGQIRGAISMNDAQFLKLLPNLLVIDILAKNHVLRDKAMCLLLNRYADIPGRPLHVQLRDASVSWWGNPWLPSNATRWGGVAEEARTMVADWLKDELIEVFFTRLAEDGLADPRRMNFWKRYIKSMGHIEFALGPTARNSTESDFVALRKKMDGLICDLEAAGPNNAFIMRLGSIVAVEFSDAGALYAYSTDDVPFDTKLPLRLPVEGRNSLKHRTRAVMRETHHGSEYSWNSWERNFETKLRASFNVFPDDVYKGTRPTNTTVYRESPKTDSDTEFSLHSLTEYAKSHKLEIDDKRDKGGNLWVRGAVVGSPQAQKLVAWGFTHKADKGWWK